MAYVVVYCIGINLLVKIFMPQFLLKNVKKLNSYLLNKRLMFYFEE